MSFFKKQVLLAIEKIPYGNVASYGQIALYVGVPGAARQIGWILNSTESDNKIDIPWWRVINNTGRISIKGSKFNGPDLQRKLLMTEGILVQATFDLDIEKYRWRPIENEMRDLELPIDYVKMVVEKYRV